MDINLTPGKYIVAVSGGVDSVALINLLSSLKDLRLVVAHFDHGIRTDSSLDRKLVGDLAHSLKLPFVYEEGKLGPGASEAMARKARYEFLESVRHAAGAKALITGHHQDDLLETVVLNILRGTGRKGLAPMLSSSRANRPLLHVPKQQIIDYAKSQGLDWREDSTNADTSYLRNHVRHKILPRFSEDQRQQLLKYIMAANELNQEIDTQLNTYLSSRPSVNQIDRESFIMLPHLVAREALATWLRDQGLRDFDGKLLERLVVMAKTAPAGKYADINSQLVMHISNGRLALVGRDR